jgi:hypothetical protein
MACDDDNRADNRDNWRRRAAMTTKAGDVRYSPNDMLSRRIDGGNGRNGVCLRGDSRHMAKMPFEHNEGNEMWRRPSSRTIVTVQHG